MDKLNATELLELALAALRDLEDAIRKHDEPTMNLKTEVLRQALFNILEILEAEKGNSDE